MSPLCVGTCLGLLLVAAGCGAQPPSDARGSQCWSCVRGPDPEPGVTYEASVEDALALATGVWEGDHPGVQGVPPFHVRLTVTPDPAATVQYFRAAVVATYDDGRACVVDAAAQSMCAGLEVPAHVDVTTEPFVPMEAGRLGLGGTKLTALQAASGDPRDVLYLVATGASYNFVAFLSPDGALWMQVQSTARPMSDPYVRIGSKVAQGS